MPLSPHPVRIPVKTPYELKALILDILGDGGNELFRAGEVIADLGMENAIAILVSDRKFFHGPVLVSFNSFSLLRGLTYSHEVFIFSF